MASELKPLLWVGTCLDDLREFPAEVKEVMGYALYVAQTGGKHPDAKPLKGFGGAGVLEVVEQFDGNAYRAVYTVKFAGSVYALHAFEKKSKKGIATPQAELERVKARLKLAQADHEARVAAQQAKEQADEERK